MTLQAPAHLRGKMTKWTPQATRDERLAWMKARVAEGYSFQSIDAALGLRANATGDFMRGNGISISELAPKGGSKITARRPALNSGNLSNIGLSLGQGTAPFNAMPYAARAAVVDSAAKTGKTIIETLADFWAAHHGEAA